MTAAWINQAFFHVIAHGLAALSCPCGAMQGAPALQWFLKWLWLRLKQFWWLYGPSFLKALKRFMDFCSVVAAPFVAGCDMQATICVDFGYGYHPTCGGTHWHNTPCGSAPCTTLGVALLLGFRIHRMWTTIRLIAHNEKRLLSRCKGKGWWWWKRS